MQRSIATQPSEAIIFTDLTADASGPFHMNQQPCVTQDLQLLADFGPDISIIRMKLLQFTGESINFVVGEFGLAEAAGRCSARQCPAALRGFDFADGFEPGVTGADFLRRKMMV